MEPATAALLAENASLKEANVRAAQEVERFASENARVASENARVASENARVASENARASKEIGRLRKENSLFQELLRLERAARFGRSSEKLAGLHGQLLFTEGDLSAGEVAAEAAAGAPAPGAEDVLEEERRPRRYRRRHPGRAALPEHLERVAEDVPLSPAQKGCGKCGCQMETTGHECTEVLDIVPAKVRVKVVRREKAACKNPACEEGGAATAPAPPRAFEKAKVTDRFVAATAVAKYADHQPCYRQAAAFKREGLDLSRKTLYGYLGGLADRLSFVYKAMCGEVLAAPVVQGDETRVTLLGTGGGGGGASTAWIWQYSDPGGTLVYEFKTSRARAGPEAFLEGYQGTFQCDAYTGYDGVGGDGMVRAGCMAHSRRRFTEALRSGEARASGPLAKMAALYGVEAGARGGALGPEERLTMRHSHSSSVFEELYEEVLELRKEVLPQSAIGKACDYFLGQRERLAVFLGDGAVEIDNNLCENGMRPVALGRRNWLFVASEEGGENAAVIASVVETCRRLEINPQSYLEDLLEKIGSGYPANRMGELTPKRWKESQGG